MSQGLPVTCLNVLEPATVTFDVAADVTLAGRAVHDLNGELAGRGKIALEIHVEILPDRFRTGVPATDSVGEQERDRVNGGGDTYCRVLVQPRQTCPTPEDIGDADEHRDNVSVSIEYYRSDV